LGRGKGKCERGKKWKGKGGEVGGREMKEEKRKGAIYVVVIFPGFSDMSLVLDFKIKCGSSC